MLVAAVVFGAWRGNGSGSGSGSGSGGGSGSGSGSDGGTVGRGSGSIRSSSGITTKDLQQLLHRGISILVVVVD